MRQGSNRCQPGDQKPPQGSKLHSTSWAPEGAIAQNTSRPPGQEAVQWGGNHRDPHPPLPRSPANWPAPLASEDPEGCKVLGFPQELLRGQGKHTVDRSVSACGSRGGTSSLPVATSPQGRAAGVGGFPQRLAYLLRVGHHKGHEGVHGHHPRRDGSPKTLPEERPERDIFPLLNVSS